MNEDKDEGEDIDKDNGEGKNESESEDERQRQSARKRAYFCDFLCIYLHVHFKTCKFNKHSVNILTKPATGLGPERDK